MIIIIIKSESIRASIRLQTNGPPLSPWQASIPPSETPAQIIDGSVSYQTA